MKNKNALPREKSGLLMRINHVAAKEANSHHEMFSELRAHFRHRLAMVFELGIRWYG